MILLTVKSFLFLAFLFCFLYPLIKFFIIHGIIFPKVVWKNLEEIADMSHFIKNCDTLNSPMFEEKAPNKVVSSKFRHIIKSKHRHS